jgi:hypothetical protein
MDPYINDRLQAMKQVGIKRVKPQASGRPDECPLCRALSGKVFPIEEFPEYPPAGCTCAPACGCVVVRVV